MPPPKSNKPPRRPQRIVMGPVRAKVVRGPKPDDRACWYWQAIRYSGGGETSLWSGWATVQDATRIVADIVARGPDAAEKVHGHRDIVTVRDLVESWLAWQLSRPDITANTAANNRKQACHVVQITGAVLLSRLGTPDLETHQRSRLGEGAATSTVANEIAVIIQAWRWGRSRGYVPDRTIVRPKLRQVPRLSRYVPDVVEFWRAVDALPASRPWLRTMALVVGATGARVGEVAALRWEDVRFDRAMVRLDGKTGERWAAIDGDALEHLRALAPKAEKGEPPPSGRVLPVTITTAVKTFRLAWRDACLAADVPYGPPKQLRAMAENRLFDAGADPGIVSKQLGHTPEVSLRHYRAAKAGAVAEAVRRAGLGSRPKDNVLSLADERRKREAGE